MKKNHAEQAPEQNPDAAQNGMDRFERDEAPREIGGREGPDPTRFGDWEKNGRCIDF